MQVKSIAEHSTILSTFIKLSYVISIFVLSIFEWPLKTGFTVCAYDLYLTVCCASRNPCSDVYQRNFVGNALCNEPLSPIKSKCFFESVLITLNQSSIT